MTPLRRLLWFAAKRIAGDERVQAKAAEVIRDEVKPRAKEAWRRAKPTLDTAGSEIRDIARDIDLPKNTREFTEKVKRLVRDRNRRS
jgi:hypothetical protein